MLDRDTRSAVLKLHAAGNSIRSIARSMAVSRKAVRGVIDSGAAEVPELQRPTSLDGRIERIEELFERCRGNLVRVHEELEKAGIDVPYSTLTGFCRRRKLGVEPKQRVGRYTYRPGQEMQHDTSPHRVKVGGRTMTVQCASLVLCYSRMLYAQVYPRWSRFECRVFVSQSLEYMGGSARQCMLDNSTVVIARGTGKHAVPAPAMQALSDRFGFVFVAHELGDKNRSAPVERPFHYIENNFYAGRDFVDIPDLNAQLEAWCDRVNRRDKKALNASPIELYAHERSELAPLPLYIPQVYDLHQRKVDVEGYVRLHTNRYSMATELIGLSVEIRETIDKLRVFDGHRLIEEHDKQLHGAGRRVTLEKHRRQWRQRHKPRPASPTETLLRKQGPEISEMIDTLQKRYGGRAVRAVRRLHRMWTDYPTEALTEALQVALRYGLTDIERIERMVLRRIAGDFFRLPIDDEDDDHG